MANITITFGFRQNSIMVKMKYKVILQAVPFLGKGYSLYLVLELSPIGRANFVPCSIYPWESQFTFGIIPYLSWCVEKYLLWIKKIKESRLNSSKKKTLSRIDHQRWMRNLILTLKKRTHSFWFSLIASAKTCLFVCLLIHS